MGKPSRRRGASTPKTPAQPVTRDKVEEAAEETSRQPPRARDAGAAGRGPARRSGPAAACGGLTSRQGRSRPGAPS